MSDAAGPYERRPSVAAEGPALNDRLKALWESEGGFTGWLATVDHKQIGLRYIVTAFAFSLRAVSRR